MKKYTLIILTLLLCISTFSCGINKIGDKEITAGSLRDNVIALSTELPQIYFFESSGDMQLLNKYDVLTGSYTLVCEDQLCSHERDSECKFAGISSTVVTSGEWAYFTKMENVINHDVFPPTATIRYSVCGYNYVTSEFKVLHTSETGEIKTTSGSVQYDEGYIYFFLASWDSEAEYGELSLTRIVEDTGEVEFLCTVPGVYSGAIRGDSIFYSEDFKTIYKADVYNNNRVDILQMPKILNTIYISGDGNFVIYQFEDDDSTGEIYKFDMKTGESIKLFDSPSKIFSHQFIGDYMYYTLWDTNIQTEDGGIINLYKNKLYRVKLDGSSETELIYEDANENTWFTGLNTVEKYLVVNTVNVFEKLVLDIETGEVIYTPNE